MNRTKSEDLCTHSSFAADLQQGEKQLMSTMSPPKLTLTDEKVTSNDTSKNQESSSEQMNLPNSWTSPTSSVTSGHQNLSYVRKQPAGSYMRQSSCDSVLNGSYLDMYTSGLNPSKNGIRGSLPAHNLTTLEPSSLRYTKVSLYPSWTLTTPKGILEQSQTISSRAASMTELAKRVEEFSNNQGRKPLKPVENNASDNKYRTNSEQGLKSDLLYDRLQLTQGRKQNESRFDNLYNNSKSGYPSSNVDTDRYNIGDKEYNVPFVPERDGERNDQQDRSYSQGKLGDQSGISYKAVKVELSPKSQPGLSPLKSSYQMQANISPESLSGSSDINITANNGQNIDNGESSNKYLDKGFVSSFFSQRDIKHGSGGEKVPIQQNRTQSLLDLHKQSSSMDISRDRGSQLSLTSLTNQSPGIYSKQQSLPVLQKEPLGNSDNHSDRTTYSIVPAHSGRQGAQNIPKGSEKSNTYIVRSTLCYNTSTQTDLTPYPVRVSDLANEALRLRQAEIQGSDFITHTSPRTVDIKGNVVEDKSVQTAMFDLTNSNWDVNMGKLVVGTNGGDDDSLSKSSVGFNNHQTSSFIDTHKNHGMYTSPELMNLVGNKHSAKPTAFNFSDKESLVGKLSGEHCSSEQDLMSEKRTSSRESPRLDAVNTDTFHQSGVRKPESYHSQLIRHGNKYDLLSSRDHFGSVSSLADSRHDSSSMVSYSSQNIDMRSSMGNRSLDLSRVSPKTKMQMHNNVSSSPFTVGQHREISSSSGSNLSPTGYHQFSPEPGRKCHDLSFTSGLGSDISSIYSNPKCFSLDRMSSRKASYADNLESSLHPSSHMPSSSPNSSGPTFQWKKIVILNPEELRHDRLGSDSVFTDDDDRESSYLQDEDLNKTLSPRRDFGFYSAVDRNILDSNKLSTNNDAVERFLTSSNAVTTAGTMVSQSPKSRVNRYSESIGLRQIKEESDTGCARSANDNTNTTGSGVLRSSFGGATGSGQETSDMYQWKNEAWLKSHFDIPKGSLKRATSEQTIMPEPHRLSSYKDGTFNTVNHPVVSRYPHSVTAKNYEKNDRVPPFSNARTHAMTSNEDLTSLGNKQDLKMNQKKALLDFYERKTSTSSSQKRNMLTDPPSLDTSSSSLGHLSFSESVADVISKVNENIAKSAQRLDGIRRNSSSSSRSSLDFMDSSRPERNRRETDWTRLRSLGPVRYSPDIGSCSSRSSLASDKLYEDINRSLPSTPRRCSVDSRDRDFVQDPVSLNASTDNRLAYSSKYKTLPPERRSSSPPAPSPSQETEPPALPPRKNRKNQQALSESKTVSVPTSTMLQESTKRPVPAKRKSPVHVIPLGKEQDEDIRVDNTQMNFKDLMTQWKNTSPGDKNVGLRKQAEKVTNSQYHLQQQQQHHPYKQVNYLPATYERARINASFDPSYKCEQTQKQEASSTLSSTTNTSSVPGTFTSSSPSSLNHQPMDGYSSSLHNSTNSLSPSHHSGGTIATTKVPYSVGNTHAAINNKDYVFQNVPVNGAQPSPAEKTSLPEYLRSRSSSDLLSSQPPGLQSRNETGKASSEAHHMLRERSSSDYDILSDTRQHSQLLYQHQQHFGVLSDVLTGSKLQSTEGGHESLMLQSPIKGGHTTENTFRGNKDPFKSTMEVTDGGGNMQEKSGLIDESYIGHMNKSNQAFNTYKRSTSIAVLQSGRKDNCGVTGDVEDNLFQEKKLGQHSWNSELVLSHAGVIAGELLLDSGKELNKMENNRTGSTKESLKGTTTTTPVRPPRPSAQGRNMGKSTESSMLSSMCVSPSSKHVSVSLSALDSLNPSASCVPDHSRHLTHEGSNRRPPPSPPASPPFDPKQTVPPGHCQTQLVSNSNNTLWSSGEGFRREPLNSIPQSEYSPQRKVVSHDSSVNSNLWIPRDINNTPLPSTQGSANHFQPGHHHSPSGQVPVTISSRDYQQRESAPIRLMSSSSLSVNTINAAMEDPALFSSPSPNSIKNSTSGSNFTSLNIYASGHSRQLTQEELECDEKAEQLAKELENKDQKLLQVLRQDTSKGRMLYMNGLLSESSSTSLSTDKSEFNQETSAVEIRAPQRGDNNSNYASIDFKRSSLPRDYQVSFSQVTSPDKGSGKGTISNINESITLIKRKEELIEKLHKKLEVLREEKVLLQQEIVDNNLLGTRVCQIADSKCQTFSEKEKFKTYIDDREKIVLLLLNLSGQIARVESAVQALGQQAETKLKKLTLDKREKLHAKHEEAKLLKEDIDRRSESVLSMLQKRLSEQELSDYKHFLNIKSKLTIEMKEVDDKIAVGEQQLLALQESLSVPTVS